MKEEILKILANNTKGLPKWKQYLYNLIILLLIFFNAIFFAYLGFNLSFKVFLIIGGVYSLVMVYLGFVLKGKGLDCSESDIGG